VYRTPVKSLGDPALDALFGRQLAGPSPAYGEVARAAARLFPEAGTTPRRVIAGFDGYLRDRVARELAGLEEKNESIQAKMADAVRELVTEFVLGGGGKPGVVEETLAEAVKLRKQEVDAAIKDLETQLEAGVDPAEEDELKGRKSHLEEERDALKGLAPEDEP
jgi:hypothetical protein